MTHVIAREQGSAGVCGRVLLIGEWGEIAEIVSFAQRKGRMCSPARQQLQGQDNGTRGGAIRPFLFLALDHTDRGLDLRKTDQPSRTAWQPAGLLARSSRSSEGKTRQARGVLFNGDVTRREQSLRWAGATTPKATEAG
jgi:hypothetical protein